MISPIPIIKNGILNICPVFKKNSLSYEACRCLINSIKNLAVNTDVKNKPNKNPDFNFFEVLYIVTNVINIKKYAIAS